MARLLEVEKLKTHFNTIVGVVKTVDDVSYYSMKAKSALSKKKVTARPLSA